MNPYYLDYGEYLARLFPGRKVQKLSVNTGRGCPNRDGTIGSGGCIYCNNRSFTPPYCFGITGIKAQLEAGKTFFGRKYPEMDYLAYFQSYTSTHGVAAENLLDELEEALSVDGVKGIVIGTRPDTLTDGTLDVLRDFGSRSTVILEIGVESLHDSTLQVINRGHTAAQAIDAVRRAAEAGLHPGVHLIAGLPEESEEMMFETIDRICREPVESIKLHQLQVLRDTPLERMITDGRLEITPFTPERYMEFCVEVVKRVPRRIAIDRFLSSAPRDMVVMPNWGIKNHEFSDMLLKRLKERCLKETNGGMSR